MRACSALAREANLCWLIAEEAFREYLHGYDLASVDSEDAAPIIGRMNRALRLAAMVDAGSFESETI